MKTLFVSLSIFCLALAPEGIRRRGLARFERALCFGEIAMSPVSRMKAINFIRRYRIRSLAPDVFGWMLIILVTALILY